jgi:Domain of unknown function (DUF929)
MAKKKHNNTQATRNNASRQVQRQQRLENTRPVGGTATAARTTPAAASGQKVRKQVARRNTGWWWIGGIVLACVAIIGVFIFISNSQKPAGVIGPTDPAVLKAVSNVSQSVSMDVNTGGVQNPFSAIQGQQPLTGPNGKPQVFYYGAEFCPYCAANRWSMAVALSRFGTFSQLPLSLSSGTDTAPNTSTLTFLNSKYSSSVIDFVPLENEDREGKPLQNPTAAQQQLLTAFNVTGYPFLDIANQYRAGPFYDPSVLANLSQKDIANKLSDPNDTVTKNIVGAANYMTAAICAATKNQPASACSAQPIPTLMQSLASGQSGSLPLNNQPTANVAVYAERTAGRRAYA